MSIFRRIGFAIEEHRRIKKYLRMDIADMKKLSDDDLYYELDEKEPLEELLINYVKLYLEDFVFTI